MKGLGPKGPIDSTQLPLPKPDTNKLVKRAITLLAQSINILDRRSGGNPSISMVAEHLKEVATIYDKL